jgi:hypothetical protein
MIFPDCGLQSYEIRVIGYVINQIDPSPEDAANFPALLRSAP